MTKFDDILPILREILTQEATVVGPMPLIVNRDLNGRVRLIADRKLESDPAAVASLMRIAQAMEERLGAHAFPADRAILYEADLDQARHGTVSFRLEGVEQVEVIDRLAVNSDWVHISPLSPGPPRIVFFSIKGGVGRSTALAASAWALAQAGKRVLVLDLDLESPGLSSTLLPEDRRPTYGIADWLVEDLVDNSNSVFADMTGISTLAREGDIYVVPAHGRNPGAYVSKLGRVWMSKPGSDGQRETWTQRLGRLIDQLETRWEPDIILIDSRAGIDEIAASCVTGLGANLVLLFALDGVQTWTGYRILFQHWQQYGIVQTVRERLQLVGALIPDDERRVDYFDGLREHGHDLFSDFLYDAIPVGDVGAACWNFDKNEIDAPHYPLAIKSNRSFEALRSLHERLERIDATLVSAVFGPLIEMLLGMEPAQTGDDNA